jgi:outer membrane lipase/esterase
MKRMFFLNPQQRFARLQTRLTWPAACVLALLGSSAAFAQTNTTGLTPNEESLLGATTRICKPMGLLNKAGQLDPTEQQLFFRCNTILNTTSGVDARNAALNAISPEELNAAPRANINFGQVQHAAVVSRLLTLREGSGTLGGGSGDESSSLSEGKLGTFFNVKDGFGSKEATTYESDYRVKSNSVTLGADYRATNSIVVGVALGFGWNKADFSSGGDLKTDGEMGSLYTSWYGEHQAVDFIATFGTFDNQSRRLVEYTLTSPLRTDTIDSTAVGSTRSYMTAIGLSYSYDFGNGAWNYGPTLAVDYLHVNVHGYSESSVESPELDLSYGPQGSLSLQVQPGFNVSYAISGGWGVFTPYLRAVYVRETKQDQTSFFAHYVYDTPVSSKGVDGSFLVTSDRPDHDYFRLAEGLSATFAGGVSAFLDVESLVGYTSIKYSEVALGARYQFR